VHSRLVSSRCLQHRDHIFEATTFDAHLTRPCDALYCCSDRRPGQSKRVASLVLHPAQQAPRVSQANESVRKNVSKRAADKGQSQHDIVGKVSVISWRLPRASRRPKGELPIEGAFLLIGQPNRATRGCSCIMCKLRRVPANYFWWNSGVGWRDCRRWNWQCRRAPEEPR
jgi:hypothetical protein